MPCVTQCGIAVIIIIAQMHMMLTCHRSPVFQEFENSLNKEQQTIYKKVVYERMSLYFQGQMIGLLIGICLLYLALPCLWVQCLQHLLNVMHPFV